MVAKKKETNKTDLTAKQMIEAILRGQEDQKNGKRMSYDEWLELFRQLPYGKLVEFEQFKKQLPTEGYAALRRWMEIIEMPSKMDKLYQGRLKAENDKNIMELAVGDDDEAFYESLIRENVQQLNSGSTSPQETARITQNLSIFRKELRDIRSRKPKKGTVLEKVLEKANMRPCPSGLGSRLLNGEVEGNSQPFDKAGSTPAGRTKKIVKKSKKPVKKTIKSPFSSSGENGSKESNTKKSKKLEKQGKKKASKTASKAKLSKKTSKVSSGKENNG